jgi:hypothetical protein
LNWAIEGLSRLTAKGRFTSQDDPSFGTEKVNAPLQTIHLESASLEAESDIVAKLHAGKRAMVVG